MQLRECEASLKLGVVLLPDQSGLVAMAFRNVLVESIEADVCLSANEVLNVDVWNLKIVPDVCPISASCEQIVKASIYA